MEFIPRIWKKLIIGSMVLVLSMTVFPVMESCPLEKNHSLLRQSGVENVTLSGMMGENGWYTSGVQVTITGGGWGNPVTIFYKIDEEGWGIYYAPLFISSDGYHTVWWYFIDLGGNQSSLYNVSFKIDKTPPVITILKEELDFFVVKFTVNLTDATSGPQRAEFYLDDVQVFIDEEAPFEWTLYGAGNHMVTVIGYDIAGNSQITSMSVSSGLGPGCLKRILSSSGLLSPHNKPQDPSTQQCSSSQENITVLFMYPENGIYWDDQKIVPYSVPLILHGNGALRFHGFRFCRDTPIDYTITGSVRMVEFYLNDALLGTITAEPYEWNLDVLMTSSDQVTLKIIAYGFDGQYGVDEITIYRLFI